MQDPSRRYLSEALEIIRKTPSLVGILVVYTGILCLPALLMGNPVTYWSQSLSVVTMIAHGIFSLIVYPVIYGKYTDIAINQKQRSWTAVLKDDWWNLFIVTIVLNLPVLIIESVSALLDAELQSPKLLVFTTCELIGIYTIPLVFLMKEKLASISLGAKCLVGNLRFSRYLVYLTILSVIISFAVKSPYMLVLGRLWALLALVLAVPLVVIDLGVFVAASLILVEKLEIRTVS